MNTNNNLIFEYKPQNHCKYQNNIYINLHFWSMIIILSLRYAENIHLDFIPHSSPSPFL